MGGPLGRDLKRLLVQNGCRFARHGNGDHEIWFSPITRRTFTVDASTRIRHTANASLKQAGLKSAF